MTLHSIIMHQIIQRDTLIFLIFQMFNQISYNKRVSSILSLQIIITFSLMYTITAEWLSYAYLPTYLPSHTYSIYCERYSRISGNVTWSGSSDLDVYVYASGSDLFSSSPSLKYQTTTFGIQTFSMTCLITGTYYLRVQPWAIYPLYLSYSMSLRTTGLPQSTYSSTFYKNQLANKRKQAFLLTPLITTGFAVKYESLSDTSVFSISCYGTSFNQQYKLTKGTSICLPAQSSSYIFVIKDNLSSPTSIQPIQILLYYDPTVDCSNYPIVPDQQKNASAAQETSKTQPPIGIIVGCVVGFVVITTIIIIIVYCKRRLNISKQNMQKYQYPSNPYAQQNSFSTLKGNPHQNCSICLDSNCNAKIGCGHQYHRKCIEEWIKRNNKCPLCRKQFQKSQIQVNLGK